MTAVAVDGAGNESERATPGLVTLDSSAPEFTTGPHAVEATARPGSLLVLAFELSEETNGGTRVRLARAGEVPDRPMTLGAREGLALTWSYAATDDDHGEWDVVIDGVKDAAGNPMLPWRGAELFRVDGLPPGLLAPPSLDRSPPRYPEGATVGVAFATDEDLGGPGPTVALMAGAPIAMPCERTDGRGWTCSTERALDPAVDAEGVARVQLELADVAGNRRAESVPVVLDFTPPGLAAPPRLERCDGRALARLGPAEVWLGSDVPCPEGASPLRAVFGLDEPAAEVPEVTLAGHSLVLADGGSPGDRFEYVYTPVGDEAETDPNDPGGTGRPVLAEVADAAGNRAVLEVGRVRFDRTPPVVPPDEVGQRRLTLVRDPWGSERSAHTPRLLLRVDPGVFEEPGELVLVDAAEDGDGAELGRARVAPGAPLEVDGGGLDREAVAVQLSDLAGNRLDADLDEPGVQDLEIRHVEWVATLNGKRSGDPWSNPHELLAAVTEDAGVLLVDVDTWPVAEQATLDGVGRPGDGALAQATSDQAPWRRAPGELGGPGRRAAAAGFDGRRGRLVLFGGRAGDDVPLDDTFEWDQRRWVQRATATAPPARTHGSMACDPARGRCLLFGGQAEVMGGCGAADSWSCDDTWEWDSSDWARRDVASAPVARRGASLVWDTGRGRAVLFGGDRERWQDETALADTWEWDGDAWVEAAPGHSPPARFFHGAAYDAGRRVVVVFGGTGGDGRALDDTWEWDGRDWTEVPVHRAPSPRAFAGMAFDAVRGTVLLFGGEGPRLGACGWPGSDDCVDTWEWDGMHWRQRAGARRPRLTSSTLVEDPRGRQVLLYGVPPGRSAREGLVFEWDGGDWRVTGAHDWPAPRAHPRMAWDGRRHRAVAFGGIVEPGWACAPDGSRLCRDTWEWADGRWVHRAPQAAPPARHSHALLYHGGLGRVVVVGGCIEVLHPELVDVCSRVIGDN